jgi:hypothetical protein
MKVLCVSDYSEKQPFLDWDVDVTHVNFTMYSS